MNARYRVVLKIWEDSSSFNREILSKEILTASEGRNRWWLVKTLLILPEKYSKNLYRRYLLLFSRSELTYVTSAYILLELKIMENTEKNKEEN
jgi:hypothetical protein